MPLERHTGRLLVATPSLGDPNFDRTVVLLLEHGDEGAVGVVLNRVSNVDVAVPLPDWGALAAEPSRVFVGGPVSQGAVLGLARVPGGAGVGSVDGWSPLLDDLGTLDLSMPPSDLALPPGQLRVFTGYAGWGAGQLEHEVEGGAWFVVEAEPADPFTPAPEALWAEVMKRQPTAEDLLAATPRHPWLN